MKVTVIRDSVIHAQQIYKVGDSFELDDDVAISLMDRGYVSIIGDEGTVEVLEEKGVTTMNVPFERADLELMEYRELVTLANELGLKVGRKKKDEVIERILEFRADEEVEEIAHDEESETDELPNTDMPDM